MIYLLYEKDPAGKPVTGDKIDKTIREFSDHPEKGRIVVFTVAEEIVGYAITVYYWSNEYGGDVVNIDELFVKESWRNQGIATRFFSKISSNTGGAVKALQLEVTPTNQQALSYYEHLGFEPTKNSQLLKCL